MHEQKEQKTLKKQDNNSYSEVELYQLSDYMEDSMEQCGKNIES